MESKRMFKEEAYMMARDEMIAFIKANAYVRISHRLFEPSEYLYSAKDGCIYDENGYLFEDWEPGGLAHNGIRMRSGGAWETGWRVIGGEDVCPTHDAQTNTATNRQESLLYSGIDESIDAAE